MINLLSEIILFCLLTITSWLIRLIYHTFRLYTLICWLPTITCWLFISIFRILLLYGPKLELLCCLKLLIGCVPFPVGS